MVSLRTDFRRDFEGGSSNLEPRLKRCGGRKTHWGCGGRETHGRGGGRETHFVGVVRGKPIAFGLVVRP